MPVQRGASPWAEHSAGSRHLTPVEPELLSMAVGEPGTGARSVALSLPSVASSISWGIELSAQMV